MLKVTAYYTDYLEYSVVRLQVWDVDNGCLLHQSAVLSGITITLWCKECFFCFLQNSSIWKARLNVRCLQLKCTSFAVLNCSFAEQLYEKSWASTGTQMSFQLYLIFSSGSPCICMGLSNKAALLATGFSDGTVNVFDMSPGKGYKCIHKIDSVKEASAALARNQSAADSASQRGMVLICALVYLNGLAYERASVPACVRVWVPACVLNSVCMRNYHHFVGLI